MNAYDRQAWQELAQWQKKMQKAPSLFGQLSKNLQTRINRVIPERVHAVITSAIKQMTRGVISGAGFTTSVPLSGVSLEDRENRVRERISFYTNTAAAEGAITGAGGILLGLADFPLWLTIKMKMLFEIASLYGYDVKDYKERVYILHVFQLTFSSQRHRNNVYKLMATWESEQQKLPDDIHAFDWRSFQQEYRDYIDLAKLLQLIPGIGAAVGAYVNHRLTNKLGSMAMNAYRLRLQQQTLNLPNENSIFPGLKQR
jgi:uncharacterized protein (DUF697 family)